MFDTWSCGPQTFAALSPITHIWYVYEPQNVAALSPITHITFGPQKRRQTSADNACSILGRAQKLRTFTDNAYLVLEISGHTHIHRSRT